MIHERPWRCRGAAGEAGRTGAGPGRSARARHASANTSSTALSAGAFITRPLRVRPSVVTVTRDMSTSQGGTKGTSAEDADKPGACAGLDRRAGGERARADRCDSCGRAAPDPRLRGCAHLRHNSGTGLPALRRHAHPVVHRDVLLPSPPARPPSPTPLSQPMTPFAKILTPASSSKGPCLQLRSLANTLSDMPGAQMFAKTHAHTRSLARTHARTHAHTHTHTHAHTHTHTFEQTTKKTKR